MEWNDALKLRPIRDGGVYVLACPAEKGGGVEIMLGTYKEGWQAGGKLTPAIYFAEITELPADAGTKAKEIREALPAIADLPIESQIAFLEDETDMDPAGDVLGAEE